MDPMRPIFFQRPVLFGGQSTVPEQPLDDFKEALGWLTGMIKESGGFAAGPKFTVADMAILAGYSSLKATGIINLKAEFPELEAWFDR